MRQIPISDKKQSSPDKRTPLDQLFQLIAKRIVRKLKEMQNRDGTKYQKEKH